MNKEKNITAISYFIIHFFVELICFTLITKVIKFEYAVIFAFVFDFFAFVPQIFCGVLNKKFKKLDFGTIGVILMLIGLCLFKVNNFILLIISIIFVGLGNAFLHECGAISTVVKGEGKLFPSALFVSGGSFGLVIGKYLSDIIPFRWLLIIPLLIIEIFVLITNKYWLKEDVKYPEYKLTKKEIGPAVIVFIATLITFVRSFIGYAIPISWNKSLWQTFFLFFMMGLGKAFGGFVSDKIGAKKTGIITTLLCIPFLIFGENIMSISIIGVFLFSMTMSITFGMILSVIKNNPGVAFGFTTIGLFLGITPVFLISISKEINIILIIVLSILSAIGFYCTMRKDGENEKNIKEG